MAGVNFGIPGWIVAWLIISSLVVCWDCGFVLMRPRSMPGGDLHWIWKPYALYIQIDRLYGDMEDTFGWGQGIMNVVENCLNFFAVFLHFRGSPTGLVVAFLSIGLTLAKTVLYYIMDLWCGFCQSGHNDTFTFWTLYILPNWIWIVIPTIAVITLGTKISGLLHQYKNKKQKNK